MTRVVELAVLPKQGDFLACESRETLYSGAFGAGKTRAICLKVAARAARPGAREGLCRKNLVTLKRTTLKTLLEPEGDLPPVLPVGWYEHLKADQIIRIKGGGEICYFGLDDPEKVASFNLSGCGVDEAVELEEADWTMLRGRIRLAIDGLPNQLYAACNPGSPSHFLAQRFGLAGAVHPAPGCVAFQTRTIDNPFLRPEYVADLETLTGVARKRFFEGQWAGSDRLVYDAWDRAKFVKSRNGERGWKRTIIGHDVGHTNPGVFLLMRQDNDGRIHVEAETYARKLTPGEWLTRAREYFIKYGPEAFVIDPSSPEVIAEWRKAGLPAVPANNERKEGVRMVRAHLHVPADGRPRLTVDPTCEATIKEFESWETMPDDKGRGDEFSKVNDHAMDALRYGVMFLTENAAQGNRIAPIRL